MSPSIKIQAPMFAYHDVSGEFAMWDTMRVWVDGQELPARYNAELFRELSGLINRGECTRERVHEVYDRHAETVVTLAA